MVKAGLLTHYRVMTPIVLCVLELAYVTVITLVLINNRGSCNTPLRLWLQVLLYTFTGHCALLIFSEALTPLCSFRVLAISSALSGVVNFILTFFSIVWFILGNLWYYKADDNCYDDFYEGYTLVFVVLIINYVFLATACCFLCVLIYQIAIGVGVRNRTAEI